MQSRKEDLLRNEISVLSELESVAPKLYFTQSNGRNLQMIMEALEGLDGARFMALLGSRRTKLSIPMLACLLKKLITALLELHRLGYAHNGIKPDNFIITRTGTVRLIDFETCAPLGKGSGRDVWSLIVTLDQFLSPVPAGQFFALSRLRTTISEIGQPMLGKFVDACQGMMSQPDLNILLASPLISLAAADEEFSAWVLDIIPN